MRLHAAIDPRPAHPSRQFVIGERFPWLLISWLTSSQAEPTGFADIASFGYEPESVIVDSGAYTAWNLGRRVELDGYARWCAAYRERFPAVRALFANLDVIPGEPGADPSSAQRRRAIAASKRNADELRRTGAPLIEVYHQFEPLRYLDELVERRRPGDLVGISPRNDHRMVQRRRWLDGVWKHLLANHPRDALPPCHGFGIGGKTLVWRYPWASTDSLYWLLGPQVYANRQRRGRSQVDREFARSRAARDYGTAQYVKMWRRWAVQLEELWARRGIALAP